MIESTGVITLIPDSRTPKIAVPEKIVVPDVVSEFCDPDYAESNGQLYRQLLELLGQDVYVLVLPKSEMVAMCLCGHIYADHLEFENWQRSSSGHISEPSMNILRKHVSYAGYHPADTVYCKCQRFEAALQKMTPDAIR